MLLVTVLGCAEVVDETARIDEDSLTAAVSDDYGTLIRVQWTQPEPATMRVDFRWDDEPWHASRTRSYEAGDASEYIIGVPYDVDVEYRVVRTDADQPVFSGIAVIRTAVRPETLPQPIVLVNDPGLWDSSSPYLLTSMNRDGDEREGQWWTFVLDRAGRVVWAELTPRDWVSRHVSVALDGQAILVDRDTFWTEFGLGAGSEVVRMTLDGTIEHTYATPGLHHAFTPVPGDAIVWGAKVTSDTETIEQVARDGSQTTVWDCSAWFAALGHSGTCGSNGLWWDAETDHLLYSMWSTDSVVEIDRATGESLRWFGDLTGSWTFDPPESQFWWQHGPTYTEDGTLMVSSKDVEDGEETVIREYVLDEDTETLVEVWNFGEGRGVFGAFMGEAHRLPNGNTLHVYGSGGHLAEATPSGDVAWEVTWEGDKHNGRTTPLDDLYALLPD